MKKFIALTEQFWLFSPDNQKIGQVVGNFVAWNFNILDNNKNIISSVKKKFGGVLKEMFTSADTYMVEFGSSDIDKRLVLAVPLMIDQIFEVRNKNG